MAQEHIQAGDVCEQCGATVRRVSVDVGDIDNPGRTAGYWGCDCDDIDGPKVSPR